MKIRQKSLDEINEIVATRHHNLVVELNNASRRVQHDIMRTLNELFKTQGYKAILGDENAPWSAYLSQAEIFYPRSKVNNWRKIISVLEDKFDLTSSDYVNVPESRLINIARVATSAEDAKELIANAEVLTPLDWKNLIAERKGKPTSEECKHDFVSLQVCPHCGLKAKHEEIGTQK
jgi:hypothetical protein